MTPKERVLAALSHLTPDRIPKFDSFWSEFASACRKELRLPPNTNLDDHFGIDITIAVADETPFPTKARTLWRSGGDTISRDSWGRTVRTRDGAYFYEVLEVPITTRAGLDRVAFDPPTMPERYGGFERVVAARRAKSAVFCKTGGPYLRTTFIRGETDFLMDCASDPEFAKALADRVADHIIEIGVESIRRGNLADTGLWIYDDMAFNDQPFVSPKSFERIFLPAYCRMVEAFRRAGARHVILHSDGNIGPLLDMLLDAGIDGINPVEPKASMSVVELKRRYGDRLSLIGGMCNANVLPFGAHAEIAQQAREIIECGRDGGVIIGAHSIGPDIPVASYCAYHDTVMSEGVYQ